jgi:uncharacterized protein
MSLAVALAACLAPRALWAATPAGPSFDCNKVETGSIEALVCADEGLAALDRKLAGAYAAALAKATREVPPTLKVEQRGWIKGRDDCWKSPDQRACVESAYVSRIAELQARYRLVPATGPVTYTCSGPADEVVVSYFPTEPPTLIAERGDSVSLMYRQPDGSYQGRNETLTGRDRDVLVTWGFQAPQLRCRREP